jgi:hypothetical protein
VSHNDIETSDFYSYERLLTDEELAGGQCDRPQRPAGTVVTQDIDSVTSSD